MARPDINGMTVTVKVNTHGPYKYYGGVKNTPPASGGWGQYDDATPPYYSGYLFDWEDADGGWHGDNSGGYHPSADGYFINAVNGDIVEIRNASNNVLLTRFQITSITTYTLGALWQGTEVYDPATTGLPYTGIAENGTPTTGKVFGFSSTQGLNVSFYDNNPNYATVFNVTVPGDSLNLYDSTGCIYSFVIDAKTAGADYWYFTPRSVNSGSYTAPTVDRPYGIDVSYIGDLLITFQGEGSAIYLRTADGTTPTAGGDFASGVPGAAFAWTDATNQTAGWGIHSTDKLSGSHTTLPSFGDTITITLRDGSAVATLTVITAEVIGNWYKVTTSITAPAYIAIAANTPPGAGQLGGDTATGGLNIRYTDANSIDRTAVINAIQPGETIRIVDSANATYYSFVVTGIVDYSGSGYMLPYPANNGSFVNPVTDATYYLFNDGFLSPPPPPSTVTASLGIYSDRVDITWSAAASATGYAVYVNTVFSVSGAEWLGNTIATSISDTTAVIGKPLYYFVKAVNAYGAGDFSASSAMGFRALNPSYVPTPAQVENSVDCIATNLYAYTTGTFVGGIAVGNIVDPKWVLTGHNNYVGGAAGTLVPVAAAYTQVGHYNYVAGVTNGDAGACYVPSTGNVLKDVAVGVSPAVGTFDEAAMNTDPGQANVWTGVTYKILNANKTGAKHASDITNCSAANIVDGVTIDDVTGEHLDMTSTEHAMLLAIYGDYMRRTDIAVLPVIDGKTFINTVSYISAALCGSSSGAGTGTETIKNMAGTDKLRATFDVNGNRTVTLL